VAYIFGDGFDCYAAAADAVAGYWDGGAASSLTLVAGRFAGGQAFQQPTAINTFLVKNGANDALHHITIAFRQTTGLIGTNLCTNLLFSDGATAQCSVLFRSDGTMLLYSGNAGTIQATYTGAVSAQNTWFAFEIEILISSTGGYMNVRKNGNTSNDFTSATNLNTRAGTANNYANRLSVGHNATFASGQQFDDLLWRSDASSVPWVGDIRCYTRMPASDAAVQFARSPGSITQTVPTSAPSTFGGTGKAMFTSFTAAYSGTVTGVAVSVGSTGTAVNMKCAIHADNGGNGPGVVLASATAPVTPVVMGTNAFTFSPGVSVVKGTQYWVAACHDGNNNYSAPISGSSVGANTNMAYASFPQANPVVTSNTQPAQFSWTYASTANWPMVAETLQDGTTSYVYDATVNDADFYTIAAIASTPATVVAVTTRGFVQKSDAGTRGAAVQLKSGATTVTSTPTLLSSSFGWLWRTDVTDPATGAAWTAAAVNNVQIGPKVTS